jgi:tRNA A-37 threonylcarbamoyl transferase component Bud32
VAEVFELGFRLVKLTAAKPAAFREAAIHAAIEAMGLPVPKVWSVQEIGGRWRVVFDRVRQASFAEQMFSNSDAVPRYLECIAQLHTRIHAHGAYSAIPASMCSAASANRPRTKRVGHVA